MSLTDILSSARFEDGRLSATIGPDWLQGRTAYGGASTAIALSAVKAVHTDLPPLRSAQIAFVGPLAGDVVATPVLLRYGKNSAFVNCDVASSDGIGIRTMFLFMTSRPSAIAHVDLPLPVVPSPDEGLIDPATMPQGFLRNFDSTAIQADHATMRRWARLRDRDGLDPETELVAIADALPPAAMALAKQWGPISSTTWQLNIVTNELKTTDGWWLLETTALHAGDGNSSQTMTIWNRNGSPVATATQSVAIFI